MNDISNTSNLLNSLKRISRFFRFCSVGVHTRNVIDELYERVLFFKSETLSNLPIVGQVSISSPDRDLTTLANYLRSCSLKVNSGIAESISITSIRSWFIQFSFQRWNMFHQRIYLLQIRFSC